MNHKKYALFILFIFALSAAACKKQVELNEDPGKAIQLTISGSSPDSLEYLVENKVVAVSPPSAASAFEIKALFSIKGAQQELQIRKKGTTDIIQRKIILASSFDQNIKCYYDGTKLFDQSISVLVKGYAETAGDLEFILDGKVIGTATGPGNISIDLAVLLNAGETREIAVRRAGETEILLRKTVSDVINQRLTFYYDGHKIANPNIAQPADPLNIGVIAKFETTLTSIYNGPADMVFFTGTLSGANITPANIRIALPADGSFSNLVELPPLPDPLNTIYFMDICKSGTNEMPYHTGADFQPVKQAYMTINLTPGNSLLYILKDQRVEKKTGAPASRGTTYSLLSSELSQYFR